MLKRFKNKKGFSLIELMIVVAILGIIATIAIPILLTARNAAIREKARNSLRTVISAEAAYYSANGTYTDLATLNAGGYLDARFVAGDLGQGITITVTGPDDVNFTAQAVGGGATFTADASGDIVQS